MTDHDARLLSRFAKDADEAAFRELVARHFNLVFSVALRQLNGDTHLAEDVAQTVFTDLARKARFLSKRIVVTGWLYEAARRAASKVVRGEQRRRAREQEAVMIEDAEQIPDLEEIGPVLDSAMGQLNAPDRAAVLLHYFERRGFHAVGAALGISDDAAQKRVTRALPKLRAILLRRGVTISATMLGAMLSASAVKAAPMGMAYAVSTTSLTAAATAPAGFGMLLQEVLRSAKVKMAFTVTAVLLIAGGAGLWLRAKVLTQFGRYTPVDLSRQYNGDVHKAWTKAYPDNDLRSLARGRQRFHKVTFDIEGVIQLQGQIWKAKGFSFPERVENIPVQAKARRIHLLHAESACAPAVGTRVATLVLNYTDGERAELPIQHGVHCFDWWAWNLSPPTDINTMVAWTGPNEAARNNGIDVQLFQTAFRNPEPTKMIRSIDYVSGLACAAPFMVALTVEH